MTLPYVRKRVDFVKGPVLTEYITSNKYKEEYFL